MEVGNKNRRRGVDYNHSLSIIRNSCLRGGFTLIELLVVVSIIGVLMTLTLLGLQGSRESARNTRRKSDIEQIRVGLELYKTDCKGYPTANIFSLTTLVGDDSTSACSSSNTYLSSVPKDPLDPDRIYRYSSDGVTYSLCASLENVSGSVACGGVTQCGSEACNYVAANP